MNRYESANLLFQKIPIKYKGNKVIGLNSYTRIELLQRVIELSTELSHPKVLEVGCGCGINMLLLNHLCPSMHISGFEYTHARLASALINLKNTNMVENLYLGDATSIKKEDNSYDIVFSFHVLEQLGQKGAEKALYEMWRLCRKGVILDEPGLENASLYESIRVKKLGYCRNLVKVAKNLPGCRIKYSGEGYCRAWPNPSNILVLERL
jgi:ubiquinone/menaquinone biosynthesis C-methylase UbiE